MHERIHQIKPWVLFGISPFGLGQPTRRAPGIAGFSQYDKLYADVELWLQQGWLDYLAPQLYWPIDQPAQAFAVLLDTWARDNPMKRHIWPGLFTSRIDESPESWTAGEIISQIDLVRRQAQVRGMSAGHVHFSMVALLQDRRGVSDTLARESYAQEALLPETPWLNNGQSSSREPSAPLLKFTLTLGKHELRVAVPPSTQPRQLAVWRRYGSSWRFAAIALVRERQDLRIDLRADSQLGPVTAVRASWVDRFGRESAQASWEPAPKS